MSVHRKKFYESLPKGGIIAEIGVFNGDGARCILEHCQPKELWLIDVWSPVVDNSTKRCLDHYLAILTWAKLNSTSNTKIKIIRDQSLAAANFFPDEYFDWVFVDGDHRYGPVRDDLHVWTLKTKKDGYICGDDFTLTYPKWEGVHKAVIEYVLKYVENKPDFLKGLMPLEETWPSDYRVPQWLENILVGSMEHYPYPARIFKIKKSDLKKLPSADDRPIQKPSDELVSALPGRMKKILEAKKSIFDLSDVLVYDASEKED